MKLARIKDICDEYHRVRAEKHGWLYYIKDDTNHPYFRTMSYVVGVSLATKAIVTLFPEFVEITDAVQGPEGQELSERVR